MNFEAAARACLEITGHTLLLGPNWTYVPEDRLESPDGEGALHEICHWIVALPDERALLDYGLIDPDEVVQYPKRILHIETREQQACALERHILIACGFAEDQIRELMWSCDKQPPLEGLDHHTLLQMSTVSTKAWISLFEWLLAEDDLTWESAWKDDGPA